jgi:hypothetical protein
MIDAIFDQFSARDVAKAVAASNRILIELMVANGVDRNTVERAYKEKAQELITKQFDDGTGQLLMLLGGVVPRSQSAE